MKEINLPFLSSKKKTGVSGNQPNGNGVSGKTVKPAVFSKIDPLDVKKKLNQRRPLILVLITILILSVTVFRQTLLKVISLSQENIKKGDKLEKVTTKSQLFICFGCESAGGKGKGNGAGFSLAETFSSTAGYA